MKVMKTNKKNQSKKTKINMYAWGQKNKKLFAGILCIILVLGMIIGLLQ